MHILVEARVDGCHSEAKRNLNFPCFPQGHRRQLSMLNIQLSLWKQSTKRRPCCNHNFYNNHINNNYQDCNGFNCKQKITLIARLASPAPNLATSLLLSVLWCKPITLVFTMSWVIINILFFRAIFFYPPLMSSFSWSCLESGPSSGRHGNRTRLPNRSTITLTTNFIALVKGICFMCHFNLSSWSIWWRCIVVPFCTI